MSDLIELAKERMKWATQGRRVQFDPAHCPEAEGAPFSEWDSSHETSVILPDGTRYRGYSRHKHSADAELDNMAPDLARALIDTAAERDALREYYDAVEAFNDKPWKDDIMDMANRVRAARAAIAALQKDTPNG